MLQPLRVVNDLVLNTRSSTFFNLHDITVAGPLWVSRASIVLNMTGLNAATGLPGHLQEKQRCMLHTLSDI